MNGDDTKTESALYQTMAKFVPFKAGNATVGLSNKEELLKNIDSPLLSSLKGSLVGSRVNQFPMNCLQVNCIEKKDCEDVEKAINLISNLEYEQVKHFFNNREMLLSLCTRPITLCTSWMPTATSPPPPSSHSAPGQVTWGRLAPKLPTSPFPCATLFSQGGFRSPILTTAQCSGT